jgi:hypothetical protein
MGYTLDAYPWERERYRRELGETAIGEFASRREATRAVFRELRRRGKQPLGTVARAR